MKIKIITVIAFSLVFLNLVSATTTFKGTGTYAFYKGVPPSTQSFKILNGSYIAGNPNYLLTPSGSVIINNSYFNPTPMVTWYISNPEFFYDEIQQGYGWYKFTPIADAPIIIPETQIYNFN